MSCDQALRARTSLRPGGATTLLVDMDSRLPPTIRPLKNSSGCRPSACFVLIRTLEAELCVSEYDALPRLLVEAADRGGEGLISSLSQ